MYQGLYTKRQHEEEYLPRKWYVEDAQTLPWVKSINIKVSDKLIKDRSRGLIYAHNCETHGGLSRFDYTIIIAEGLSPEYERIVSIKELMHCYFPPTAEMVKYRTSSEIVLDNHFRAFFGSSAILVRSAQVVAELMALWMAIGVLTTEHHRKLMAVEFKKDKNYAQTIMETLRIPLVTAKALVSKQFEDEIADLLT